MSKKALDFFGEALMSKVRDEAIIHWDYVTNGKMKGEHSEQIYNQLSEFTPEQRELVQRMIPKVVNTTLHYLLWMLEQEEAIDVAVKLESEEVESIREISDGLTGELYTEDGWFERFSKQRYEELK
ncbi:epimerase [Brevibacillus fortis]|uniref:Epimerase n=1 Tax=Brevibacillus fortis TaxID=2126352 RepID=A0A2P7VH64_9BACL|nr:epimerase [Brevibacillus fortis]PSJ98529.1 epimerase [Brevibacillus fortis]